MRTLLLSAALMLGCGSAGEQPSATQPMAAPPAPLLEQCAPSEVDDSYAGVSYPCAGRGRVTFEVSLSCDLPKICYAEDGSVRDDKDCQSAAHACPPVGLNPERAITHDAFAFEFGGSADPQSEIAACCDSRTSARHPPAHELLTSCDLSCGATFCGHVTDYFTQLRGTEPGVAQICCIPGAPGEYDCLGDSPNQGPLRGACDSVVEQWIALTATTQWQEQCRAFQAGGEPAPLDDVNDEFKVHDFDVELFLRATTIDAGCSTETYEEPTDVQACSGYPLGPVPRGWPTGG